MRTLQQRQGHTANTGSLRVCVCVCWEGVHRTRDTVLTGYDHLWCRLRVGGGGVLVCATINVSVLSEVLSTTQTHSSRTHTAAAMNRLFRETYIRRVGEVAQGWL